MEATEAVSKPTDAANPEEKEIEQKMIKVISLMPKEVQTRFKLLKVLSDKRSKLNDQLEEEIAELESKVEAKKKPLYNKRREVIEGKEKDFSKYTTDFDFTTKMLKEECATITAKKPAGAKTEEKEKEDEIPTVDVDYLKGKDGVPDFWFKALKNNHMLSELIKEKDEEILQNVRHIEAERSTKPKMMTLRFFF